MGSYNLRLKRASRLPSYSRQYIKGDPAHLIDWKAYARSDNLIVREVRDDASASIAVVVDMADTMHWPDASLVLDTITKWQLSLRVAFHIAYTHLKKGDRVNVYLWDSEDSHGFWRLNLKTSQNASSVFHDLEQNDFMPKHLKAQTVPSDNEMDRYQLNYLISDLLRPAITKTIARIKSPTRYFHILSSKELNMEWLNNQYCYFDESRGRKEFLGNALKSDKIYRETLEKWLAKIGSNLHTDYSDYQLFTDKTTILHYLSCLIHLQIEGG